MSKNGALAALLAMMAACGGAGPRPPRIEAFAAADAWTAAVEVQATVAAGDADLEAAFVASVGADGLLGREVMVLGAEVGDALAGRPRATVSRRIETGTILPAGRIRLRVADTSGRGATAEVEILHPAFGGPAEVCAAPLDPCAGELACSSGRCAVPPGAAQACAIATDLAWVGGVAEPTLPAGAMAAFVGRCSRPGARGDIVLRLSVAEPGGEHLELTLPGTVTALLRRDCTDPRSEYRCLESSGSVDLEAGDYVVILQGQAVDAGQSIRMTRAAIGGAAVTAGAAGSLHP